MTLRQFKDKIDGHEIDLSLGELTDVPEKELASFTRVTYIDLSRNHLSILSRTFSSQLGHIVKLDLGKNCLTELPMNFGLLTKLKILDLYGNKLTMLPVSFCQLKSLKWLDLKDNPLDKQLASVAGDCLDEKQCQTCAKNVVSFMHSINSQLEKERQKRLKIEQDRLKKLREAEEEEKNKMKMLKKQEKDKRKAEHLARLEEQKLKKKESVTKADIPDHNHLNNGNTATRVAPKPSGSCRSSIFTLLLKLMSILVLMPTALIVFDHLKYGKPFEYPTLEATFYHYISVLNDLRFKAMLTSQDWCKQSWDLFMKYYSSIVNK